MAGTDTAATPALAIDETDAAGFDRAWPLFREVVAGGDTWAYAPDIAQAEARALWTTPPARCFVAMRGTRIVGLALLKPNQPGLGDHVANAGFMVASDARGQGIASALCEHAMARPGRPASPRCSSTTSSPAMRLRYACGNATASPSSAACRARSAMRGWDRPMCW